MPQSRSRLAVCTILRFVGDLVRLVVGAVRSRAQLSAENLFVRKQLALYVERRVKPRRADDATRITLVALSRLIDWPRVLTLVNASLKTICGLLTKLARPARRSQMTR